MKTLTTYLTKYAEAEITFLIELPNNILFSRCLVIPACSEEADFVKRIVASPLANETLLILVVNQALGASKSVCALNVALAEFVQSGLLLWKHQTLSLYKLEQLHVLLVDRFSTGNEIPVKEGVGRARKVGCDLAVCMFAKNILRSPWIYSSDADVYLPDNYFDRTASSTKAAAQVFNFQHLGDAGLILDATLVYERAIKFYRDALAWAGSPYAFYTLGSTIAVDTESYCKVRGFPARAGGEDFYLLNKLAKIGSIHFVPEIILNIEARLSERVPFGTGPASIRVMETLKNKETFTYYNPNIFQALKCLLKQLPALHQHIRANKNFNLSLEPNIIAALEHLKFARFTDHCEKQNIPAHIFENHFHTWFDAFQTLKFVHFLQSHAYPAIDLNLCIHKLEKLMNNNA